MLFVSKKPARQGHTYLLACMVTWLIAMSQHFLHDAGALHCALRAMLKQTCER